MTNVENLIEKHYEPILALLSLLPIIVVTELLLSAGSFVLYPLNYTLMGPLTWAILFTTFRNLLMLPIFIFLLAYFLHIGSKGIKLTLVLVLSMFLSSVILTYIASYYLLGARSLVGFLTFFEVSGLAIVGAFSGVKGGQKSSSSPKLSLPILNTMASVIATSSYAAVLLTPIFAIGVLAPNNPAIPTVQNFYPISPFHYLASTCEPATFGVGSYCFSISSDILILDFVIWLISLGIISYALRFSILGFGLKTKNTNLKTPKDTENKTNEIQGF